MSENSNTDRRVTTQRLMPIAARRSRPEGYDVFPEYRVVEGEVGAGFAALIEALSGARAVAIDGVPAVDWTELAGELAAALEARGSKASWIDARERLKPAAEIDELIAPYLGGEDPLFGTRCDLTLEAFLKEDYFAENGAVGEDRDDCPVLWYGPGAALLAPESAVLVFVDMPKNEEQFRARGGGVTNLGTAEPGPPREMYKRSYFVDWPVMKRHKASILPRLDWYVDAQWEQEPAFLSGDALRGSLDRMSRAVFRPRPWFEPGPWGGQWLQPRVREACAFEPPNLAWSFEMIAPENGIVLTDGRLRCEASLEWLLAAHGREVLGFGSEFFGDEFPIRFDFLDTMNGGNLSLQCHPGPECISSEFGERFTQDETYYILDRTSEATVYLGFREGIDPDAFRAVLEESDRTGEPVEVEEYVQRHPAARHDLFLIPHGTVHSAGRGTLVLEISATPYIFTFKLYDWLRLDLGGRPRPLNIARAFENLNFARQGQAARDELLSRPRLASRGPGWKREVLPTHADHFYAIERYTIEAGGEVSIATDDSPHVLMVVEGPGVDVRGPDEQRFAHAETFVVPAAARSFRLVNPADRSVVVIASFLEPRGSWPAWMQEVGGGSIGAGDPEN